MLPAVFVVLLALMLLPAGASAAGVTATVAPETVRLASGGQREVMVLVANGDKTDLNTVVVTPLKEDGLDAPASTATTVAAGDTKAIALTVSASAPVLSETTVTALVRYQQAGKAQVRGTTFKVAPKPALDPAKIATLSVKATFDAMRSDKTTPVYLTVANTSEETLTVGQAELSRPEFVTLELDSQREVEPHETVLIGGALEVTSRVRPGKHQLVFSVPVRIGDGGPALRLTSAHEATVTVDGESDFLTAAGIPSVILAPGLLLLGVAALLWDRRLFRHRSEGGTFPLEPKSAQFIVVSVTVSFAVVGLWKLLGRADFFDSYGRRDVMELWAASIVAGAVLYTIWKLPGYRRAQERIPTAKDDQLAILRKLDSQGLTLRLPCWEHKNGDKVVEGYMLQPYDEGRAETWFAPQLTYSFKDTVTSATTDAVRAAISDSDPGKLADALEAALADDEVDVGWADDTAAQPYPVKQTALGAGLGPKPFARQI
jgi:hypothetical protein